MSEPPLHSPADVLVVDDAPANLQLLFGMLKERGYRVRPVASGRTALQVAAAQPPDLVLLDVNMPEMNGYEVCRRLKEDPVLRAIPVIFISALSEPFDKLEAFAAGGVDYVMKPFHLVEVRVRIATHVALWRLQLRLEARNEVLRVANARLVALEEMKKILSNSIVHDLKSPLAALLGSTQFLLHLDEVQGDTREVLGDMHASADGMHRMIMNLLDVSRMEDAALVPRRQDVMVAGIVEKARSTAQLHTRMTGHLLAFDVDHDQVAHVDPDLLTRVVDNLLDNSLKYAPRGSAIRLEARATEGRGLSLRIEDKGAGVPAEHRERIFERGARLDRDLEVHGRTSRGLGLAFCRMVVEAHGGKIWVEDGPRGGSVFCVEIPPPPP